MSHFLAVSLILGAFYLKSLYVVSNGSQWIRLFLAPELSLTCRQTIESKQKLQASTLGAVFWKSSDLGYKARAVVNCQTRYLLFICQPYTIQRYCVVEPCSFLVLLGCSHSASFPIIYFRFYYAQLPSPYLQPNSITPTITQQITTYYKLLVPFPFLLHTARYKTTCEDGLPGDSRL
jgi:hypothetical protein